MHVIETNGLELIDLALLFCRPGALGHFGQRPLELLRRHGTREHARVGPQRHDVIRTVLRIPHCFVISGQAGVRGDSREEGVRLELRLGQIFHHRGDDQLMRSIQRECLAEHIFATEVFPRIVAGQHDAVRPLERCCQCAGHNRKLHRAEERRIRPRNALPGFELAVSQVDVVAFEPGNRFDPR